MAARAVMVQGTGSYVGKSIVVAALCRAYARAGIRVAPFKAQNMSNNSFVTQEGGEMGRAQAFQARAAGVEPHVDMNPILLKPEADTRCQVVRLGQPVRAMEVREYHDYQRVAWEAATQAFDRLRQQFDLIVLEGAGSPAEINLRERDLVNMRMAAYAEAPVLLIGDIERGGVFAALVGTMALLEPPDRDRVRGLLINKFRGDATLLKTGLDFLESHTGVPVLGVLPFVFGLPVEEEDAVALDAHSGSSRDAPLRIGVLHLPHISNATDFEPLQREPDVAIRYIDDPRGFDEIDVVILPGTKSTVADLMWMRLEGMASMVLDHHRRGGWTIGICGGLQMMGRWIHDPHGVESPQARVEGLGLLPITTTFEPSKRLVQVEAECVLPGLCGAPVRGYEIHHGLSLAEGGMPAFRVLRVFGEPADTLDGAATGLECFGTYLHGLFDHGGFRREYLNQLRASKGLPPLPLHAYDIRPKSFDQLADWFLDAVDLHLLAQIIGLPLNVG